MTEELFNCAGIEMSLDIEHWPLRSPFRIAGRVFNEVEVLLVTLESSGKRGRGESAGVYYHGESALSMMQDLERVRGDLQGSLNRGCLRHILPAGGARNAVDCALWDLESAIVGSPIWQIANLEAPRPLLTNFGCDASTPEVVAKTALAYVGARAIKLKLTGDSLDADRVIAARDARPDVHLSIDANQGFTRAHLESLLPVLVSARVELIEQPFPVGSEFLLDGMRLPIALAADESVQTQSDVAAVAGRFDVVNIKLDKCGGLTEGFAMLRACRDFGIRAMVGSMLGTSLSMAPAYLLGQQCDVADLDAPIFLQSDRPNAASYLEGLISCPRELWG